MHQVHFLTNLENDLNTANAITLIYDILKDQNLNDTTKIKLVEDFDKVLSLDLLKQGENHIDETLKNYIEEQIKIRQEAKQQKDYQKADAIRDELLQKGIKLIDSKEQTTYEIITRR